MTTQLDMNTAAPDPHIYNCALGREQSCLIRGRPFRWCYRCLEWISTLAPEGICEPNEPCPFCAATLQSR